MYELALNLAMYRSYFFAPIYQCDVVHDNKKYVINAGWLLTVQFNPPVITGNNIHVYF